MRISISWLKEFVDFNWQEKELEEKLAMLGFTVESYENDIFDLEITPNRGDCLSILGIAREIAALCNSKIHVNTPRVPSVGLSNKIDVQITDSKICPRFTARIIDGIKIGESPEWMQKRLISYGFRPINNIVDITNYVMIELGQPLHAFDYSKIKNGLMKIRQAKEGERLMTLDGKNWTLPKGAIVIEDSEKIYDLAGIMGGKNSEVDENTKTIILQGAIFDPILIRRTSKKLHHITEASYRYERGVDFLGTVFAVNRATSLIAECCPTAKIGDLIDIQKQKFVPVKIQYQPNKINSLLGTNIRPKQMEDYLKRFGFIVKNEVAQVPSWRSRDIKIWQDLAEEIARLMGYQNIKKTLLGKQKPKIKNQNWILEQKVKDYLVNLGFTEIESYPYLSISDLKNIGIDPKNCLEIANPISPEARFLRPSLLPLILKQVAKNTWAPEIKIFEIGNIFTSGGEKKEIAIASTKKNEDIGVSFEEVKQNLLNKFKIRKKLYIYISDLKEFANKVSLPSSFRIDFPKIKYRSLSPFPPVVFDLAIVVSEKIKQKQLEDVIKESSSLIYQLELFDIYSGPQLPKGKKSFAYHLTLSSPDHTLKNDEIKKVRQKIILHLKQKIGAHIRGENV